MMMKNGAWCGSCAGTGLPLSPGYARTVVMPVGEAGALITGEYEPITVSRRIGSPASVIFQILADPGRHCTLMAPGCCGRRSAATISGAGDFFVMTMYITELGNYEMNNHVVECEPNRRIGWEPEAGAGTPMPPWRPRASPLGRAVIL